MIDRLEIVAAARSYLGVPFMHQGRTRDGIDCAGLLTCVAYDLGIRDVRVTDYARMPDAARAKAIIEAHMDPAPYAQLAPGDAISFVIMTEVQHYGLVTEINPHKFIHAYGPADRVVEQPLNSVWLRRLRGCYRFRASDMVT